MIRTAKPKTAAQSPAKTTTAKRTAVAGAAKPAESRGQASGPAITPSIRQAKRPSGKLGALAALLETDTGTTIEAMMEATGWQAHSIRGAISGSLKKKLGLEILSEKTKTGRIYRIVCATKAPQS